MTHISFDWVTLSPLSAVKISTNARAVRTSKDAICWISSNYKIFDVGSRYRGRVELSATSAYRQSDRRTSAMERSKLFSEFLNFLLQGLDFGFPLQTEVVLRFSILLAPFSCPIGEYWAIHYWVLSLEV
jgi:hypothetical protein